MLSTRYKIRIYESGEGDGAITDGEIVRSVARSFSVEAYTMEDVRSKLCQDVAVKKMDGGKIYQICPPAGNAQLSCNLAIDQVGLGTQVFLDPAAGLYSEFRRIRYPRLQAQADTVEADSVPA
jgi:hypothetical protein